MVGVILEGTIEWGCNDRLFFEDALNLLDEPVDGIGVLNSWRCLRVALQVIEGLLVVAKPVVDYASVSALLGGLRLEYKQPVNRIEDTLVVAALEIDDLQVAQHAGDELVTAYRLKVSWIPGNAALCDLLQAVGARHTITRGAPPTSRRYR